MCYLNRSLLLANIVSLQLLWLWQRSADRRPGKDNWDEGVAAPQLLKCLSA